MVNRLFAEQAALRGICVIVWTRSWYFAPSLWENDGKRSDEGFLSGFYATISDHADKYLSMPVRVLTENGKAVALMRDGTRQALPQAEAFDLGAGQRAVGVWVPLPTGGYFYLF